MSTLTAGLPSARSLLPRCRELLRAERGTPDLSPVRPTGSAHSLAPVALQLTHTTRRLAAAAALMAAAAAPVRAQRPAQADTIPAPHPASTDTTSRGAQTDSARAASASPAAGDTASAACPRGVISQIFIDNNSVFLVGDPNLDARFNWAYRLANKAHARTRESVIRRELLFTEGSCYRPELLEDSERILRATSYLADADVFSVRQSDGTHHVIVETRDEWSTRLEAQLESGGAAELSGLELREDNLAGRGGRVSAYFKEQQGERVYGVSVGTPQLFGSHLDAELGVARTPVGNALQQRIALPFRGEGAHWAFREQVEYEKHNFEFFVPRDGGLERRLFPEERSAFDIGGMLRLGRRGNLTLFGLSLAGERVVYPQDTLTASRSGTPSASLPGAGVVAGLDTVSSLRLVFLVGQRNVWFDRRRALDAVRGAEDVRLGIEVELGIGRSLEALSTDDDLALDFGFSAAGDLPGGILAGTRVVLEGKRDYAAPTGSFEWRDVFGQVDGWSYWRPSPDSRHTLVAAVRAAGGWQTRVPFQVTLGQRAGLRGYPRHEFTGERRVVGTLEHRMYLGWPYPRLFDLGTALFVDAGRTWAGGDPFGQTSVLQVSAGGGLRVAFPPNSRRTYRIDLAFPVSPLFKPGSFQVSIGIGQAVGRGSVSYDPQLRRSSRRSVSPSLFNYPN